MRPVTQTGDPIATARKSTLAPATVVDGGDTHGAGAGGTAQVMNKKVALAAGSLGLAMATSAGSAAAYTAFPPWHQGLVDRGSLECLNYNVATTWMLCDEDIQQAVQFDPNDLGLQIIHAWDGSCLDDFDQYDGSRQLQFSSCSGPSGWGAPALLSEEANGLVHDLANNECMDFTGAGAVYEQACSTGNPWEWTGTIDPKQTPELMYAYYPIVNQNLVVTVPGDQVGWYQRVDVTAATSGASGQRWWSFFGEIILNQPYVGNWCLTADSPTNGAEVYLAACGQHANQTWVHVAPNQLVLEGTEMCLDVPGRSLNDGTYLEVWECNGGLNQQFDLPPAMSPE
jgi:hypothetical protein